MRAVTSLFAKNIFTFLVIVFPYVSLGQTTFWTENFNSYSNNTGIRGAGVINIGDYPSGVTKWSIDPSNSNLVNSSDFLKVSNGVFQGRDIHGKGIWTSESMNISAFEDVEISADFIRYGGTMENTDSINFYYRIDGGSWETIVLLNGNISTSFQNYSVNNLNGSTVQLKVEIVLETGGAENYAFDNVEVKGTLTDAPACTNPLSPTNGSINFALDGTISWEEALGASSYDVYLEADNPNPQFVANVTGTSFSPAATLEPLTTYYYKIVPKNIHGFGGCDTWSFTTENITYCSPTFSNGTQQYGDYIANVTLGDINNTTGGEADYPYYNYYNSMSTDLNAGASYSISLQVGTYVNNNVIAAWIDFNKDGDFSDANEKLGERTLNSNGVGILNFSVPVSAKEGITRLRVRESYGNAGMGACSNYQYGETEDYNVNILAACTDATISLNSGLGTDNQTVCAKETLLNIGYLIGGDATGANVSGLPNGLSGSFNSGVFTISGQPIETGIFSYTVTTTGTPGECSETSASGTITVNPLPSAPIAGNLEVSYNGSLYTASASVEASEVVDWYNSATGNSIASAPSGTDFGTYTAWAETRNTATGCVSETRTEVTLSITKADQFIISGEISSTLPLNSFDTVWINSSSSSGLPISVDLEKGSAATLNNDISKEPPYYLTNIGTTGFVTIHETQPGNSNYNAASPVSRTFDVTKSNQTISFPSIDDLSYFAGLAIDLKAVASSGLNVIYNVVSGPASISGSTLTVNGVGKIWVSASQDGDASYNAAANVIRSFNVVKGEQTITVNIPAEVLTESTQITANSTSGLPVTLTLGEGSAAAALVYNAGGNYYTLSGIGGSGEIYFVGNQAGDNNFLPASEVVQTIALAKSNQTISFTAIGNKTYEDPPVTLSATATSGLSVAFSVISGPATLTGNTLTITGAGTIKVVASQSGDGTYNAAPNVTQQFEVLKKIPVISQTNISKNFGDDSFDLNPVSTSSGVLSFVSGDSEVFTVSGNTVTIIGAGTANLNIIQQPTSNYFGVTKTVVVVIDKASSVVSMTGATGYTFSGLPQGPATATVIGSSGDITYNYIGTGSTSYGPSTVKPINAGTYSVTATVSEDDNYAEAVSAPYAFSISKANATITVNSYAVIYDGSIHVSTGSVVGVLGEALSGLELSGTAHTNAGTYNGDAWIFTDVSGNYNNSSGAVNNSINAKDINIVASDQIKCFGDAFTFSGTEFSSSGLVTGETIGTVTLSSAGTDVAAGIGSYLITPSGALGGTFNPSNYVISYLTGEMTVKQLPTLDGAVQSVSACHGSSGIIELSGLIPNTVFSLDYSINGIAQNTITGLSSDAAGNSGFFTIALNEANNGQVLQITGITITSETPSCSQTFAQNVVLSVNPAPTLLGISQEAAVCEGSSATINLTGLVPGTTYTLGYNINGGSQIRIENLIADGSGNSSFSTPVLTSVNNGQILQLESILITSNSPGCSENFTQNLALNVIELSNGGTANGDQSVCIGETPSDITLSGSIGTVQWQSSLDNSSWSDISGATNTTLSSSQMWPISEITYFRAQVSNGTCSSANSNVVTISINSSPNVQANASSGNVCEGESVILTGSGANSYVWDNGVTNGIPFTPATTTTYTVSGTDLNGCSNTDQITITVNEKAEITLSTGAAEACLGETGTNLEYTSSIGSPNTYSIDFDLTAENEDFVDVNDLSLPPGLIPVAIPATASPGTYTATLTVENSIVSCGSVDYNISITIHALPGTGTITIND